MQSILELERRMVECRTEMKRAKAALLKAGDEWEKLEEQLRSRIATAVDSVVASVLDITGPYTSEGAQPLVVLSAIESIAMDDGRLTQRRFATKNYESFRSQRDDVPYGMSPRHGSINFSIGFTKEARQNGITEEQAEACVIYLRQLLESPVYLPLSEQSK